MSLLTVTALLFAYHLVQRGTDMTKDLTLIELQAACLADPEDHELKETFRQMVANWSHLEDCLMEETPD